VAGIQSLEWSAGVALQAPIFSVWSLGWQLGSAHMIREMIAAVPESERQKAEGRRFAITHHSSLLTPHPQAFATAQEKDAIAALLKLQPGAIVNTAAEQAVLRRTIQLAGNFGDDQLAKLKVSLIGAISPDASGKVLSRKELLDRIQADLNVGRVRAQTIARTELTTSYNTSRVTTALQSSIVTHFRFLAISDQRTCLVAETLITMADGSQKAIVDIQAKEMVMGGSRQPRQVIATQKARKKRMVRVTLSNGAQIVSTDDHLYLSNAEWVEAQALQPGMQIDEVLKL
jgi:hypothetical protein